MPAVADYGIAYLDTDSFRASAALFGVGMSLCNYPATNDGNAKLAFVLQSASRMIDAFCARDFLLANKVEKHPLDLSNWQFKVNNPPVIEVVSCLVRYAIDGHITIDPDKVFVNNQQGFLEIARYFEGTVQIMEIGTELNQPIVEITYKSLQSVPTNVQLACGFQAGHMINTGFVDATLPPNFGKVDMSGLSINNKKGYRSSEEMMAGSFSPEAERMLIAEKKISIA